MDEPDHWGKIERGAQPGLDPTLFSCFHPIGQGHSSLQTRYSTRSPLAKEIGSSNLTTRSVAPSPLVSP